MRARLKILLSLLMQVLAVLLAVPAIFSMAIVQDRGNLPEGSVVSDLLTFGIVGFAVRILSILVTGLFWLCLIGGLWVGAKKLRGEDLD